MTLDLLTRAARLLAEARPRSTETQTAAAWARAVKQLQRSIDIERRADDQRGGRRTPEDDLARRRSHERFRARRGRAMGTSFSMPVRVAALLFEDADRVEALEREIEWYRTRLPKSAQRGPDDPRPRVEL